MHNYCNIVKNKLNTLICNMEKNNSDFIVNPKRDFVRKSELSFSQIMKFILGIEFTNPNSSMDKGHGGRHSY